jgi:hypothetical protein
MFTLMAAFAMCLGSPCTWAQVAPAPEAVAAPDAEAAPADDEVPLLTADQIDTLVAPIALYPDALVAQIFPAATFPIQVVQAARWVKANPDLTGLDAQDWDESIKALARYPQVLNMMDEKLDWTTNLGTAFVTQQQDVLNSVQQLRVKAQVAGNLATTPQQTVIVEKETIQIVPTDPQIIYVPVYNPTVVYVQAPPPPPNVIVAPVITFGVGLTAGLWLNKGCNWHSGSVYWYGGSSRHTTVWVRPVYNRPGWGPPPVYRPGYGYPGRPAYPPRPALYSGNATIKNNTTIKKNTTINNNVNINRTNVNNQNNTAKLNRNNVNAGDRGRPQPTTPNGTGKPSSASGSSTSDYQRGSAARAASDRGQSSRQSAGASAPAQPRPSSAQPARPAAPKANSGASSGGAMGSYQPGSQTKSESSRGAASRSGAGSGRGSNSSGGGSGAAGRGKK